MQLASRAYDAKSIADVQELYHSNGWTDGLPIVPPTEEAVRACLDWVMMPPDQLIGIEPVRGLAVTAEKLAINAVMAGCLPMHFPVVITAWTAMMQDEFLMHGATASTGGCAVLVVLNGPIRLELGASGTFNALGNSDRATAVIGRADPALPDQPDGRAAGRHRPLDARSSRQVQLLPRRGRGGLDLAAACTSSAASSAQPRRSR